MGIEIMSKLEEGTENINMLGLYNLMRYALCTLRFLASTPLFSHLPILSLALFLILSFSFSPIISSSHLPILSEAWPVTYYVDATNGNDANNGLSEVTPWKTIAKVNASRFNPGVRR